MSRQAKLTAGPITAQLVRLCLPLLAANVLQQLYNIINSLVVTRHIGGEGLAPPRGGRGAAPPVSPAGPRAPGRGP